MISSNLFSDSNCTERIGLPYAASRAKALHSQRNLFDQGAGSDFGQVKSDSDKCEVGKACPEVRE